MAPVPDNKERCSAHEERQDSERESIDILVSLPFGTLETLRSNGITTISDLIHLSQDELLALDGLEAEDVVAIVDALRRIGHTLI